MLRNNICWCVETNHKLFRGRTVVEVKLGWWDSWQRTSWSWNEKLKRSLICGTATWCGINNVQVPLSHHADGMCIVSTCTDCGDVESEKLQRCESLIKSERREKVNPLQGWKKQTAMIAPVLSKTYNRCKSGYSKGCCVWSTGSARGRGWPGASSQPPLLSSSGWAWSDQFHSYPCPPCSSDRSAPTSIMFKSE